MLLFAFFALLPLCPVVALNFDWEREQLTENEASSNAAYRFGSSSSKATEDCRFIPDDDEWPGEEEWSAFNATLGGVLLKPKPLGSICYSGPDYDAGKCEQLQRSWTSSKMHSDDPISTRSQWASASSCPPTLYPNSTCTQGGWPVYVVNASTTRHIQLAVNFARNRNIRLVIKNSGHDFNGKNIGGHALSIWTHNLGGITYHPEYTSKGGGYVGKAVSYAAGTQAAEGSALMSREKVSMMVAGGPNVGIAGGYLQGGGHSGLLGWLGFAADQVLEMTAVTADGRVVEMHESLNEDLFWAFRGGGGGTFGVLTSVVVKAFPTIPLVSSSIRFSASPSQGFNTSVSTETFWKGIQVYWKHSLTICDAHGLGYNFIYPANSPQGLTFTVSISMPNKTTAEYRSLMRPMLEELRSLGIPVSVPKLKRSWIHELDPTHNPYDAHPSHPHSSAHTHHSRRAIPGEIVGHTLLTSLLFPRASFSTPSALSLTSTAIRHAVESANYTVHGMSETPATTGADNAVNPAFRKAVLHIQMYEPNAPWDGRAPLLPLPDLTAQHARLQAEMQKWRDAVEEVGEVPGSYVNEGDAQDWGWQRGFWGDGYQRLVGVKRAWDPEGVFWGVGMVGSEGWEVRDADGRGREGIVVQDGRLCRVDG